MRTTSQVKCAFFPDGAKTRSHRRFRRKQREDFMVFFCGGMRTAPYFKCASSSEGANEKTDGISAKKPRTPSFSSAARRVPGTNSNLIFSRGREKKTRNGFAAKKKTQIPGGFFRGEMSTRSQSKLAFSPEGAQKNPNTGPPKNAPGSRFCLLAALCARG